MRFNFKYHKYTFLAISLILICVLLIIRNPHSHEEKIIKHSFVTIDPSSKQHWFRLKITENKKRTEQNVVKRILLWTPFFGEVNYIPSLESINCAVKNCLITSDRNYLPESDALIFHLRDTRLNDIPTFRSPFQRWILLHHEAPPNTPKTLLKHLDSLFNWTATYRLDSDVLLTPLSRKREKPLNQIIPNIAETKTAMVAWFVSNCKTNSNREGFVQRLRKSIPVDIYGDCGTKKCFPKMSHECYKNISADYRYYLAFENSICKDYITEKFFNILHTDMIPVVFGGANYSEIAPPNSYIDALSFPNPEKLAEYLLHLAEDTKKYNSYFEWRNLYEIKYERHYICKICKKLNEPDKTVWHNLYKWWFDEASCKTWSSNV